MNDYAVDILDLAFHPYLMDAIKKYFEDKKADIVGITVRNTDDCYYASREFFIPQIREVVSKIRRHTSAPVVLGGCGFSIMPQRIMDFCNADFGIKGEGEEAFGLLADRVIEGKDYSDIPGLVYRDGKHYKVNEPRFLNLDKLDLWERRAVKNSRYFIEGGQGNVETKRGCDKNCIYCADPVAKGSNVRLRSPQSVLGELENLYAQGIDCFHLCDSEFNNPLAHAFSVCQEIINSDLYGKISWYTYASPALFTDEIAFLMKKAGCAGIDFGVDSGSDDMLQRLGRDFTVSDIEKTAQICHRNNIVFMYDLLLGGPGETRETIEETIELMKKIKPSRAGVSIGIRIYPGTSLAEIVRTEGVSKENKDLFGRVEGNQDFFEPIFYISSQIGQEITSYVAQLIKEDKRFFFANPEDSQTGLSSGQNYNYNENVILVEAVKKGFRGAYWDILRRIGQD